MKPPLVYCKVKKMLYLCNPFQGRSSAGLERLSHIQKVIGSNPIVPTGKLADAGFFFYSPITSPKERVLPGPVAVVWKGVRP